MSAKWKISKDDLKRFRDSFTREQKIAIVGSMFRIAFSDQDFADDEAAFVVAICELLGYEIREEELKAFVADPLYYLNTLKRLREEQLIWYCRTLYFLVVMDGKIDIREMDKLVEYLEILEIDHDRFYHYIRMK